MIESLKRSHCLRLSNRLLLIIDKIESFSSFWRLLSLNLRVTIRIASSLIQERTTIYIIKKANKTRSRLIVAMQETVMILMQSISFLDSFQIFQSKSFSVLLPNFCQLTIIIESFFDSLLEYLFLTLLNWNNLRCCLCRKLAINIRYCILFPAKV